VDRQTNPLARSRPARWTAGRVDRQTDHAPQVYGVFGLDYKLALSTRPDHYLGELATWDKAEAALTEALNSTGLQWEVRLPNRDHMSYSARRAVS
jgi:threonyl-tRNA synthetase